MIITEAGWKGRNKADRLFEVADRQAGYFTARQAREAGYDYRLQHYYRERGHWVAVGHGLYKLRHYPDVEDEEFARLSLWSRDKCGNPQAVVSHETALRLYDITDLMPGRVHLSVPKGFRKRPPKGVVLHKAQLEEADVENRGGYRITTPLRTILDLARSPRVSPEYLEAAISEALERGLVRRKRLRAAVETLEDERRAIAERAISEMSVPEVSA
jgi:predicted transcriptional regulator of viral defense system